MTPSFQRPRLHPWLRGLAGLSLLLFILFFVDLVLHPLSPGDGPTLLNDRGVTFRYFSMLAGAITITVSLLVLRKSRTNSLAVLLLVWGASAAGWSLRSDWSSDQIAAWIGVAYYVFFFGLSLPALVAFLFLYPTGRFSPPSLKPWALSLIGLLSICGLMQNFTSPSQGGQRVVSNPVFISWLEPLQASFVLAFTVIFALAIFGALASLAWRFRQAQWLERQQIKWLVWLTATLAVLTLIGFFISPAGQSVQSSSAASQVYAFILFILTQSLAGIASGIAILRYRLWDIDVIIRRTLQYTILTGFLGLVYFGGVTVLQRLFFLFTGARSAAAVVLSTLFIAALFNPVRHRIQNFIDRRFYRRKYDAEKALAEFASTTRTGIELEQLSTHLVWTVKTTLQPELISLWLRRPSGQPITTVEQTGEFTTQQSSSTRSE